MVSLGNSPSNGLTHAQASSTRGIHAAKVGGPRTRCFPLRTVPWGTQWGQLNRSWVVSVPLAPVAAAAGRELSSPYLHGNALLRCPSGRCPASARVQDSYLVDSASSHMLVSKIKPCMSKYKQLYGETANGSLNQL